MGVRLADDSQTRRHAVANMTGSMPCLRRGIDNIPLIGDEDRLRSDHELVLTLAFCVALPTRVRSYFTPAIGVSVSSAGYEEKTLDSH